MKALTVQQPAAGAIATLGKDIENRTWSTNYRGPLAIHAGLKQMPEDHPFWEFPPYNRRLAMANSAARHAIDPRGAIIAVADLVDVHTGWLSPDRACCASEWAEGFLPGSMWPVHWVLENIRVLAEPLPFRGGLGLLRVTEEAEHEILART